jgi:hypothetical protein
MKKNNYSDNEKRLCNKQEIITKNHVESCIICKQSMKEFEKFGISNIAPCRKFQEQLNHHIENCSICTQAKIKYKADSILISKEMREIVQDLKKGQIFNIDPMKLKKVSMQIFGKLNMLSDEIREAQEKANKAVRDSLDGR